MCIICVCNIAEYIKYVKQGVNKRGGKAYSPQTDGSAVCRYIYILAVLRFQKSLMYSKEA